MGGVTQSPSCLNFFIKSILKLVFLIILVRSLRLLTYQDNCKGLPYRGQIHKAYDNFFA
jgi:hypothetical protein